MTAPGQHPVDVALAALGFVRRPRIGATVFDGSVDGRPATITVSRQGRTRYAGEIRYRQHLGYRLRVDVETAVRTRLFFVKESVASNRWIRWIYRWRRQIVLDIVPPTLAGFRAVAVDETWAGRLLDETAAMDDVGYLLRDGASTLMGSVYFGPGSLHYASPILPGDAVTPDRVVGALRRLGAIAGAAEQLEPPSVPSRLGAFEKLAKRQPVVASLLLVGGCIAVLTALGLLTAALLLLVAR